MLKHAVVAPAVLVIADELAVGVGGKGGLARAGQAEEDSATSPVRAHVGGAVHGKHALLGQQIVHDGEDGLLDLACVLAACDKRPCVLSKLTRMAASELTPSTSGMHLKPGAAITVKPGTKSASCFRRRAHEAAGG